MSASATPVESLLRRDRAVVATGLVLICTLAWLYLVTLDPGMGAAAGPGHTAGILVLREWTAAHAGAMFAMWVIMMIGMMTPSAAPVVLLFARVLRKQMDVTEPYLPVAAFLAGYLAAWTGFSAVATALQWALERAALLSPMMVSTSPLFGGLVLIAAGIYQTAPAKSACLSHCRTPASFLSEKWRDGASGAFAMGLEHGAYCLGCCWILMLLLFVGGVMNLLIVAAITVFILAEKALPHGRAISRYGAAALVVLGLTLIIIGPG